jgi:hypothetical protein
MRFLRRHAVLAAVLMTGSLLLAACGGEEEAEVAAPTTTPVATEGAAPVSTPAAGTPAASPDPEDFAEFADLITRAVVERDTPFFAERVKGRTYTCTQYDIGEQVEGIGQGLCQKVGQQLELVQFGFWRSEGLLRRPETMAEAIDKYFSDALPEQSDSYGTGAVQLYALGVTRSTDPGQIYRAAILTAITPRGEGAATEPARTARAVEFEYVEGRWVIRGMLWADVLAEELLSADTAPFNEWQRY